MPGTKRGSSRGRLRAMAPKRARYAARKSVTRRAKRRMPMRSTIMTRNLHMFSRFTNDVRVNVTGTTQSGAIQLLFNELRGFAEFQDLFDRYMITTVVHKFRLVSNPDAPAYLNGVINTGGDWNSSNWFPKLWWCPDYDDNNAETLQQLQERARTRCKILKPNSFIKIAYRPAIAAQVYRTLTSTGYSPQWNQWIDMGTTDVPHYGLKFVVDCSAQDPADTKPFVVEINTKVYFKCKDVR